MPDEISEYQPPPLPEEPSSPEYGEAVERLRRFSSLNLSNVTTIDQVVQSAGTVGQDLMRVVAAKGKVAQIWNGALAYQISMNIGNQRTVVFVDSLHVSMVKFDHFSAEEAEGPFNTVPLKEKGGFSLQLPSDKAIDPTDTAFGNSLITQVCSSRPGGPTAFVLRSPDDPTAQNGFVTLLQEGVRDILPVLSPPTPSPSLTI